MWREIATPANPLDKEREGRTMTKQEKVEKIDAILEKMSQEEMHEMIKYLLWRENQKELLRARSHPKTITYDARD